MLKLHHNTNVEGYIQSESSHYDVIDTVNALVDAHNELIDTHTVKEECKHKKYTLSVSTRNGTRKICNNCGKDYQKEEPTTPEKKCCDTWCVACEEKGIKRCIHTCSPYSHQVKLPTSSYEVTCGRCEKSIKHSCGRV